MTNRQLFKFFLDKTAEVCREFCTDFKEDSTYYEGYTVFKSDVEFLDLLKEKLKVD